MNKGLVGMFENENIKNGLKSFFFDLKEGEAFSFVHLPMFLVQKYGNSDNYHIDMFTWVLVLSSYLYFVYRRIYSTIASSIRTLAIFFCIIPYYSCQIPILNCKGGQ